MFSDNRMSHTNEWEAVEFMTSTQKSEEIEFSGSPTCANKRSKLELYVSSVAANSTLAEGQDGSQTLSGCTDVSYGLLASSMPSGLSFGTSENSQAMSESSSENVILPHDHSCVSGPPEGITFTSSCEKDSLSTNLSNSFKFDKSSVTQMIENVTESDFRTLDRSTKLKLAYLTGASALKDLKAVANKLVSRDSRVIENMCLTDVAILNDILKCEVVHQFIEGLTNRFPRTDDEDMMYAGLHVQAIECLIKCVNNRAIGISSLRKNLQVPSASSSSLDPGGNKKLATSLPVGDVLPVRKGSGILVGDNAQRGVGKIQKHSRFKWKRNEAHVSVQTHLVVYENENDRDSSFFKRQDVGPSSTDFHPLFRPVSADFLYVLKARLKQDEDVGYRVITRILETFLSEAFQDVSTGDGVSSLSILQRQYEANSGFLPKVCLKCHYVQEYDPASQNVCYNCSNNPTAYTQQESNPYLRFGLQHGTFKSVKSYEEEPLDINPSSYESLHTLLDHIHKRQNEKDDSVSVVGLDGLPGIRIKRMQYDMVKCLKHDVMFRLSCAQDCISHSEEDCEISWPYCDKVIVLGESHEEIFLNLRAASAASKFCLGDVLEELGKKSKANQESAMKRRELNRLFPMNMTFLEGALKMMMYSYLECSWSDNFNPTVKDFVTHCLRHANPQLKSLFLCTYHFMLPALVKRLGLRLHRPDIADGGSALGISCKIIDHSKS